METVNWIDSIREPLRHPGLLVRIFDTVLVWMERARERRALAQLDERMLTDIGLSRCQVWIEQGKHFWEK